LRLLCAHVCVCVCVSLIAKAVDVKVKSTRVFILSLPFIICLHLSKILCLSVLTCEVGTATSTSSCNNACSIPDTL
jgi:hypothetical protein